MTTASSPDEPRQDDDPPPGFPPPGFPPPGFPPPGFPPPAEGFTPFTGGPPPWAAPGTGGYATRFGLVRPYQGRYVSGVCAALGRATNTDPVLWRVILPVLTLFNGMGAVLYVIGILIIPGDGDSGSPLEALAGRGRSATSRALTIVLLIGAVLGTAAGAFHVGGSLIIAAVVIVAVATLSATRGGRTDTWARHWPTMTRTDGGLTVNWPPATTRPGTGGATADPSGPAATGSAPFGSAPFGSAAPGSGLPTPVVMSPGDRSITITRTDDPNVDSDSWTPAGEAAGESPSSPLPTSEDPALRPAEPDGTALLREAATYQPPFAPHGPFASAYPEMLPRPVSVGTLPPRPPAGKPASPMRRIALSAAVLAVGLLGLLDLTNAVSAPAPAYFAVALGAIGLCLFLGSFFGRVRGPITIGVILVICLLVSSVAEALPRPYTSRTLFFTPASVSALNSSYHLNYGKLTLDLTNTPFKSTDNAAVDLSVKFGEIDVYLPAYVDVIVNARARAGDLNVFDRNHGGLHARTGTITDDGLDGKGGGTLTLDVSLDAGDLEIHR